MLSFFDPFGAPKGQKAVFYLGNINIFQERIEAFLARKWPVRGAPLESRERQTPIFTDWK